MRKVETLRLKFGLYLVLDGIKKGILVYGIALLLGNFKETMIVHTSFLIIRQVSFGWHSLSNIGCILWSILSFPIITYIFKQMQFNSFLLFSISSICCIFIWLSGPIGTQVNTISNIKHKQLLHRKLKKRILLITLLYFIFPPTISHYIVLGIMIQTVTLLIQYVKNGVSSNVREN